MENLADISEPQVLPNEPKSQQIQFSRQFFFNFNGKIAIFPIKIFSYCPTHSTLSYSFQ